MCGGTTSSQSKVPTFGGLSPRVRGNRRNRAPKHHPQGSIPACAGEPAARGAWPAPGGVYPRVCGGTRGAARRGEWGPGLSPRVRGNRGRGGGGAGAGGSIPACAGEPRGRTDRGRGRRVYPRVCGGTAGSTPPRWTPGGLSPRVRGNRAHVVPDDPRRGSIPACAGEPSPGLRASRTGRVYPRVCGGTPAGFYTQRPVPGLSPRVRGNRPGGPATRPDAGSIPACAGEPGRWRRTG